MATDWIELKLGQDWNGGNIFIRISTIQCIVPSQEHLGESLVYLLVDNAFDVVGTPEEIMEMINARTGTGDEVLPHS